ncbi:MAG: kynureninase [Caldilineaceae bacterium]
MRTDLAFAQSLDAADPLAHFRECFAHPDASLVYVDGNSLGRMPHAALALADDLVTHQWGDRLIRSWNEGWFDAPERVGAKIAGLLGAQPDEVIVADSTSVNFFKLLVAGLRGARQRDARRTRILTDDLNFPSDIYVIEEAIDLLGRHHTLDLLRTPDGIHGPVDALQKALADDVALLTLSHTVFKSGYTYDMAAITQKAHDAGALLLWDLSHSAGSVPIDLNAANADLAVGCTYKYLNGGPGAPAFLYIRRDLQEQLANPIAGWMSQSNLFDFGLAHKPVSTLRRFLSGTPPVLSLALIEVGVDLLLSAGMDALRAKSMQQTEYLVALWEAMLQPLGYTLNSPRDPARRGSHISLGHPEGLRIDLALIRDCNVLPDFRYPDNIRIGIAPLYNTFADVHAVAAALAKVVEQGVYKKYPTEKPVVT